MHPWWCFWTKTPFLFYLYVTLLASSPTHKCMVLPTSHKELGNDDGLGFLKCHYSCITQKSLSTRSPPPSTLFSARLTSSHFSATAATESNKSHDDALKQNTIFLYILSLLYLHSPHPPTHRHSQGGLCMWMICVLHTWVMMCKLRSLEHIEMHGPAHDRPRGIRWRWVNGSLDAMVQALPRQALALSLLPYPPYSRAGSLLVTSKSMRYDTVMHFQKHHNFSCLCATLCLVTHPNKTAHKHSLMHIFYELWCVNPDLQNTRSATWIY